jgi:PAS domain S-box-containing protein
MPISRTNDQPILSQRLILGIGLAILLLITSASIGLEEKSRRDAVATAHTVSMLKQLADLKVLVRTAESAARGFALTGDQGFAEEFHRERETIAPAFAALLHATDDPAQRRLLEETGELAQHRLAASDELIRFRSTNESAGMPAGRLVAEALGTSQTIAENLDEGQAALRGQLERQSEQSRLTSRILLAIDLCGVALILLLAGVLIRKARRSRRELADSLRATRASKESLEAAAAERTEHLVAAHEELRRSSAVLQSTFHSMAEAVLVIDTKGHVLLSNPAAAKMLRYQPGMTVPELRALTAGVFRADGTTPLLPDEMPAARALLGEEFDDIELVTRRAAGGSPRHFVVSGRPLRDTSGTITGAALVYHDISASRETERKLQQSQKLDAIGKLTGGVAHDFNNMLTVITGTTEQLVTELTDQPRLRATAALIDQAAQRCTELIEHLLAFARRQPLHPRNVDVNATITDVAKLLRPTLGEQIEIKTMLEANLAAAHLDASQLANSVLNMAINARDAMPDGGTLTIETRMVSHEASGLDAAPADPGRYVMVSVSDTGTGMPAHVRERVFEPFFTTKDVGKGSGLGLPMVYGFVTQSGGHIRIDSAEGRGTTIRLYLPPAPGQAVRVDGNAGAAAGGSETILVVEDDALVRNFVTAQLLGLGYRAVAAADGPTALEKIKNGERFDLLLTDVVMPGGMTGRQLADEVQKIRPGTKVLYTSGYPDDTVMHHGRLDTGVLLLQKPYRKAQLAQMVRQALTG